MYGKISVNNDSEWGLEVSSSKTSQLNEALQWRQRLSVNNYLRFFRKAFTLFEKSTVMVLFVFFKLDSPSRY